MPAAGQPVKPALAQETTFDAIVATTTKQVFAEGPQLRGQTLLLEIIGGASANFTLDIQGRVTSNGTFTNLDYQQIWQAGAAALANAQLTVNDQTRRFYEVLNCPPEVQLIGTFTAGSLTIHAALIAFPASQRLLTTARGSLFAEGPAASDAAEAGNPVQIGGSVDETIPAAAGEGDVRRVRVTPEGNVRVEITKDNTSLFVYAFNADAIAAPTDGTQLATIGFPLGLAPDGALDRLRTLGDTAGSGLGVIAAAPWIPGASDVKSIGIVVGATAVNRATVLTPSSGKKVRIISVEVAGSVTNAPDRVGIYFGTGAAYLTTAANVIAEGNIALDDDFYRSWPDGGGPIGDADEVVSWISESECEATMDCTLQYREE